MRPRTLRPWFLSIAIAALGAATVHADAGPGSDAGEVEGSPVISLQPAGLRLAPGGQATVQVWLDPGEQPLHGIALELSFDADLLQVDDLRAGSLLGDDAEPGRGSPLIDNRKGKLRFEATVRGGTPAEAGPGALCEIELRASDVQAVEHASIRIRQARLLDADGRKLSDIEVRHDGVVEQERFAGARMVRDPSTGLPRHLTGMRELPQQLVGGVGGLTEARAERVYLDFLGEHADLFGVDPDDLRLEAIRRIDDHWIVSFRQVYEKLPVHHVAVTLVANAAGEILSYHGNYVPDLKLSTRTRVDLREAADLARATYEDHAADALSRHDPDLVVYVDRTALPPEPHLAWQFLLAGERPDPAMDAIFFVDTRDGAVLHSYPRFVPAVLRGSVEGRVYAENPDAPPAAMEPLVYLDATAAETGVTTDGAGKFAVGGLIAGTYDVHATLSGPFAQVRDRDGAAITRSLRCHTVDPCELTWTDADGDGLNVFFHVNWLHDWFAGRLGHSWANRWDGTPRFNAVVNLDPHENAWAGDPMLFGVDAFARSSDVVYHECSHNVLVDLYGDWIGFSAGPQSEGYAIDEGFADYFAAAATESSQLGEGCGIGRDLDNTTRYPGRDDYTLDGHEGGPIIAGAAWSLRERLSAEMGRTAGAHYADRLVFEAHQRMSTQPRGFFFSDPQESNFLSNLYRADDDNDDMLDGVPHFAAIQRAFHDHGLLQAVLEEGDSYDVSANQIGFYSGGDFYLANGRILADNAGQRGVRALGDVGDLPLDAIDVIHDGYSRAGVPPVPGWTYVALAEDGEDDRNVAFRVTHADAGATKIAIEYLVRDRLVPLGAGQSYDFSEGRYGEPSSGDLYLSGDALMADNEGQRGLVDLGDLGSAPLERVVSPPSGYRRDGVPAVVGHTYVARAAAGEEDHEIALRVRSVTGGGVTLEAIHRRVDGVLLYDGDSYDFGGRIRSRGAGGELILAGGQLRADREGQRGVIDLGDTGDTPLHKVTLPADGYQRDGVPAVAGHTYAALAREGAEGSFVVLRVDAIHGDATALRYVVHRPGFVTLYDGDGYDFTTQERGAADTGELYLAGSRLLADQEGQRGVIDLGELGDVALDAVAIPATGYLRDGVPVTVGHTYLARTRQGAGASYVVLRPHEVGERSSVLEWASVTPGTVILGDRESFDFSTGSGALLKGGDLYVTRGRFYTNQRGQRGVLDLGDLGDVPLAEVEVPEVRFNRRNIVPIVAGNTYVALDADEGTHVVFRVEAVDGEAVTLRYWTP